MLWLTLIGYVGYFLRHKKRAEKQLKEETTRRHEIDGPALSGEGLNPFYQFQPSDDHFSHVLQESEGGRVPSDKCKPHDASHIT